MKLSVNTDCGSEVYAVFKLDGSPAVEKVDFVNWSGEYHKNGKWSYTEGGVALKNGIVLVNNRSTHTSGNHVKSLTIVKDDQSERVTIGKWKELESRPQNRSQSISDEAFNAVIEWLLNYFEEKTPGSKVEKIQAWELFAQFA